MGIGFKFFTELLSQNGKTTLHNEVSKDSTHNGKTLIILADEQS